MLFTLQRMSAFSRARKTSKRSMQRMFAKKIFFSALTHRIDYKTEV